jgi:hypothetical protein
MNSSGSASSFSADEAGRYAADPVGRDFSFDAETIVAFYQRSASINPWFHSIV